MSKVDVFLLTKCFLIVLFYLDNTRFCRLIKVSILAHNLFKTTTSKLMTMFSDFESEDEENDVLQINTQVQVEKINEIESGKCCISMKLIY